MSQISQIQDKQTQDFAVACYDQNSIMELWAATEPDATDLTTWSITPQQWKEAIAAALEDKLVDQEASLSFTLNEAGQKELLAAIANVANNTLTNPSAYFEDAEQAADVWINGDNSSIEVAGNYTHSGNPEIIRLQKQWFDAEVVD